MRAHDVPKFLWLALPAALVIAAAGCGDGDSLAQRQAQVAERGAQVMPFDLDATTHTFTKADDGGVQTVVADDRIVPGTGLEPIGRLLPRASPHSAIGVAVASGFSSRPQWPGSATSRPRAH